MLLEQSIANYLSLQPYEYINTEIAEDGKHAMGMCTSVVTTA